VELYLLPAVCLHDNFSFSFAFSIVFYGRLVDICSRNGETVRRERNENSFMSVIRITAFWVMARRTCLLISTFRMKLQHFFVSSLNVVRNYPRTR
jgi:hypothetical protein